MNKCETCKHRWELKHGNACKKTARILIPNKDYNNCQHYEKKVTHQQVIDELMGIFRGGFNE